MNTRPTVKQDSLEIFSVDLLNDKKFLSIFEYWSKCLGKEVGWHYPLDLIWLMKQMNDLKIPKGAVVLDTGAGTGLSQFLLASLGYNVLSVDYADRNIPKIYSLVFDMKHKITNRKFESKYIEHEKISFPEKIKKITRIKKLNFGIFLKELIKSNKNYGSITFYRSDFRDMQEIPSNSIDCIVSISALEHNTNKEIKESITEFNRVLKSGSPMLLTTSATDKKDWLHKPSYGWCYSESTLTDLFSLTKPKSNFNEYTSLFTKLHDNKYLKDNLASFYFNSEKGGMPQGKWNPQYQPVGITKFK